MERETERDLGDLIDDLHDSPVGTEDPNIANVADEPEIVTEEEGEALPPETP